jgi:hypothetical protein
MMTRAEIRKAVRRFMRDDTKVLSQNNLCELAGISKMTFQNVFLYGHNMSDETQLRMERAIIAIEKGFVALMQYPDQSRHPEYRRQPKPELRRGLGLTLKDGRIGLKIGLENANNYRAPTLGEQLDEKP